MTDPSRNLGIGRPDLAIFVATSGHSGVDRIIANLLPEFSRAGLSVDLLRVRGHGPWIRELPQGTCAIDLGKRHVTQSFRPLVEYLRRTRPRVLLSDKDRANRTALRALRHATVDTKCFLRLGTTVSANLADKNLFDAWRERRSLRRYDRADGVIVPSIGAAQDLSRTAGLAIDRIHVLPNPIITSAVEHDATVDQPPPHPWLADARSIPVALACGSLTPRKDYATLIKAFAMLQQTRESRLLILGRGSERDRLADLATDLQVRDRIDFPGFVENPIPWMRHASVFAHTSRWEGLGIVLVEALACGTPVVAMDCPHGPSEILEAGRYGRLVTPGDCRGFAQALESTLDNPIDPDRARRRASDFRSDKAATAYIKAMALD